jgi:hypothetical protein
VCAGISKGSQDAISTVSTMTFGCVKRYAELAFMDDLE